VGDAGQEVSAGRQAAVQPSAPIPPMPVLGPGEQDRSAPYPLCDGLKLTIGWAFGRKGDGGLAFAVLRRRFFKGDFKVVESFPLTEDGWAMAWQSVVKQKPADVPKILAALAAREVAPAGLSDNAHQSNEPDAPVLATDDGAPYNAKDARKMRSALQKALQRPVILPDERLFDQAKRKAMEHRHVIIGLAVLGTGIAVIAGGIVLLALTLIPEDIHGLMTKAATVILIVGALIVAAAVANGSWLKERPRSSSSVGSP
jgi:hypothetical protein